MLFGEIKTIAVHSSTSIMASIRIFNFFSQQVDKTANTSPSCKAKTASMIHKIFAVFILSKNTLQTCFQN